MRLDVTLNLTYSFPHVMDVDIFDGMSMNNEFVAELFKSSDDNHKHKPD